MKRSRGYLSGNTRKLKTEEKLTATRIIKDFNVGDRVMLLPYPYYKSNIPPVRYKGLVGSVVEKRGQSYVVLLKVGNKEKKIISHPIHLRKVQ